MNDYVNFLNRVYNTYDNSSLSSESIAKKYLEEFYKNDISSVLELNKTKSIFGNIGILADNYKLDFLTKRLPLISDTSFITNDTRGEDYLVHTDHWQDSYGSYFRDEEYFAFAPLKELGKWIVESRDLLMSKMLFYIPQIKANYHGYSGPSGSFGSSLIPKDINYDKQHKINFELIDSLVHGKELFDGKNYIDYDTISPILELDIPVIESSNIKDFAKITMDNIDIFHRFRDLMRIKLIEIDKKEDKFSIEKIRIEINSGIMEVSSELYKMKVKKYAALIGGGVVACSVGLFALKLGDVASLVAKLIGTGGIGIFAHNYIREYLIEKHNIENMDYYYVWLFKDNDNRKKKSWRFV